MGQISVVTVGSNIAQNVLRNCQQSEKIQVVKRILWQSPLSSVEETGIAGFSAEKPNLEMDVNKTFFQTLKQCPADFLVLDLNAVLYPLLRLDGRLYTKNNLMENDALFTQAAKKDIVYPSALGKEEVERRIKQFAAQLLEEYQPLQIILIRSPGAGHYLVNNRIKLMGTPVIGHNRFLYQMENLAAQALGCHVIGIVKHYFADKNSNQGKIGPNYYEAALYQNLDQELVKLFEQRPAEPVLIDRADYRLTLERYLRAYENLRFRSVTKRLFLEQDAADQLVLLLSPEVIRSHMDTLVRMKNAGFGSITEITERFDFGADTQLQAMVRAVAAVKSGEYTLEGVDYDSLFVHQTEIVAELVEPVSDCLEAHGVLQNPVLSKENLHPWFLLMQDCLRGEATHAQTEMARAYYRASAPVQVDVWGSCISRELFNHKSDKLKLGTYLYRNSILHAFDDPIPHDASLFSNPADFLNSPWRMSVVQGEFERTAPKKLEESASSWLVMDLFDVTERTFSYRGEGDFIIEDMTMGGAFFKSIEQDCQRTSQMGYPKGRICAALDRAADFLNARYHGNVMLIYPVWASTYVDFENKLVPLGYQGKNLQKCSEFVQWCSDYLRRRLHCYAVVYNDRFFGDEMFSAAKQGATHYETAFYDAVIKDLIRLISNEKRGGASLDTISQYDPGCKLDRYLRLLPENRENPLLYQALYDGPLDGLLFQMNTADIQRWRQTLIEISRRHYSSRVELLSRFPFAAYGAEELQALLTQLR